MNNNDIGQTNGGSNNDYNVDFNLNGEDTNYAISSKSGNYNYISDLKLDEHGKVEEANLSYTIELSDNPENDQEIIIGVNPVVIKLLDNEKVKSNDEGRTEK